MTTPQVPCVRIRAAHTEGTTQTLKGHKGASTPQRAILTLKANTVIRNLVRATAARASSDAASSNAPIPESARWSGRDGR